VSRAAPVETEAKYRLADSATGERYLAQDSLGEFRAASPLRTTQHEDRYIDTPDGAMRRAGYAARIRQSPTGALITVKSLARSDAGGSIHRRDELEGPADRTADAASWPPSPARSLLLELCGDAPLVELVTVRQLRRRREYRSDQATIEVSVDEVDVVAHGSVVDRFAEMEIELTSGDEAPLQALANLLAHDPELTVSDDSKLEAALDATRRADQHREGGAAQAARETPGARSEVAASPTEAVVASPTEAVTELDVVPGATAAPEAVLEASPEAVFEASPEAVFEASSEAGAGAGTDAPVGATVEVMVSAEPAHVVTDAVPHDAVQPSGAEGAGEPTPTMEPAGSDGIEAAEPLGAEPVPDEAEVLAPEADISTEGSGPEGRTPQRRRKLATGKTPGVLSEDSVAEAGRKVLRFHFARMLAKEAGTRDGRDIEDLHQMRVATRRMRAAWRVFGDAFRPDKTRRMRQRLRSVARDLGAVRDLDVLIDGLESYRAELSPADRRALDPLVNEWHARRERARAVLTAELDSDGYSRFVDEFLAFVETEGAAVRPVGPTEPHRIRDTTPSHIWLAYEQVRAYEPVLRWADVPTLHELRIAAKWLRYTMEFVRETLGPESGTLIEKVVALQDHLGLLHDADVSAALAREFLVDHAGLLSETEEAATARYLISRERELARLRRTVGPVWRGVAGLHFRRALGRTTAHL
jgi:CHAD domain-containing protein/adenylate cyclase class IV